MFANIRIPYHLDDREFCYARDDGGQIIHVSWKISDEKVIAFEDNRGIPMLSVWDSVDEYKESILKNSPWIAEDNYEVFYG